LVAKQRPIHNSRTTRDWMHELSFIYVNLVVQAPPVLVSPFPKLPPYSSTKSHFLSRSWQCPVLCLSRPLVPRAWSAVGPDFFPNVSIFMIPRYIWSMTHLNLSLDVPRMSERSLSYFRNRFCGGRLIPLSPLSMVNDNDHFAKAIYLYHEKREPISSYIFF